MWIIHLVRNVLVFILGTFSLASFATSDIILTVTYKGQQTFFTLEQLSPYIVENISTETPWTQGKNEFLGISAQSLLKLYHLPHSDLKVSALNHYWSVLPSEDIKKYNPLFAVKKNGELMSVRDKGPVWVIYPLSDYHELHNEILHSRMVWQVSSIEILH